MTCKELLEQNKEKIVSDLGQASSPESAEKVVSETWERMLYRYQEAEEDRKLAENAVSLIRVAQSGAGLADTVGDTRIWQTSGVSGTETGKKFPVKTVVMLLAGALCGAAALALASVSAQAGGQNGQEGLLRLLPVVLETVAAVLLVLTGRSFRKTEKTAEPDRRVEVRTDPEKVFRSMLHTSLVIDRGLEQTAENLAWEKRKQQETGGIQGLDIDGIDLMAGLLEAAGSGDGEYALEKAEDVRYFLHRQGVELVDYSEDQAQLFDKLPSDRTGTIRPALIKDGKLLKKGLAGGGL